MTEERTLYDLGYNKTERLKYLLNQVSTEADPTDQEVPELPSRDEILELWEAFRSSWSYVGYRPTLVEFGQWLSASGPFDDSEPAEVTW